MSITVLHEEVCEECKLLSTTVVVFHGFHKTEDIAICKQCVIKAYDILRNDEAKMAAKGMRNIHDNQ